MNVYQVTEILSSALRFELSLFVGVNSVGSECVLNMIGCTYFTVLYLLLLYNYPIKTTNKKKKKEKEGKKKKERTKIKRCKIVVLFLIITHIYAKHYNPK